MNLLALLVEKGVISEELSKTAEARAEERGVSYEEAIRDEGIDLARVRTIVSEYFGVPSVEIAENDKFDPKVLQYIPEESAKHYGILPLRIEDGILHVGVTDPENLALHDALNFITVRHQIPYKIFFILESDFHHGFKSYENLTGEVDEALVELETELEPNQVQEIAAEKTKTGTQVEHIKEDAPITKIVATMLRYAVDGGASDIHIEPTETKVIVRFRVDGLLRNSLELPHKVHAAIIARTKILSSLRLDEKRKPQDGRFSANIDGRKIDFRVSILPTNHGEKVVMRILDTDAGVRRLEDTGVSPYVISLIRKAIQQPYGIILISGPTGSGKSTTLYAMLSEVDREGKNVLSLEDPVEYNIDGVSQSQIRPEIGYTFANGLRAALRQDPDVIMVGEIRDKETAQLAIQAALTGHLVLSTIHTNNAAGVVPRLIDMGVDPYLIAPTLQLALAQRLVRRICPGTGRKVPITGSIKKMVDEELEQVPAKLRSLIPKTDHVLYAEPSDECSNGTKGRVAVMEAIEITGEIERLVLQGADEDEITNAARRSGYITMKQDAIIKALDHSIPFEEISTVGGAFDFNEKNPSTVESVSDGATAESEAPGTVDNPPQETGKAGIIEV